MRPQAAEAGTGKNSFNLPAKDLQVVFNQFLVDHKAGALQVPELVEMVGACVQRTSVVHHGSYNSTPARGDR